MAEKNNDGLFHWNFDLKESDSDFTDIDYTAETIPEPEGSEDVKPFIFVDGKYKSGSNAGTFVDDYLKTSSDASGKRTEQFRKLLDEEDELFDRQEKKAARPQEKKKAQPAKKKSGGGGGGFMDTLKGLNWKLIGIIAAALVLLIVLAIIIFGKKKPEEPKDWELCEDQEVLQLINDYLDAKRDGDGTKLRKVLDQNASVNNGQAQIEGMIYEDFTDLVVYSYEGMAEKETALYCTYNTKFENLDKKVPNGECYYVRPDSSGQLRLMNYTELTKAENKTIGEYVADKFNASEKMMTLNSKVKSDYNKLLEENPNIKAYIAQLENGDVYPYTEPESTEDPAASESGSEAETIDTTEATQPTETQQPYTATGETTETPLNVIGYITKDNVRVRSTPNLDSTDNVIAAFSTGYYVQVIGEMDDWYHIIDNQTTDPSGNSQTPTNQEGYVYKSFVAVP